MKPLEIKPLEIKGARTRLGYSQEYVAEQLGLSVHSYRKKESGEVKFTDKEKFQLAKILELSYEQADDFLFDGELKKFFNQQFPNGNVIAD